jgi:Tat protein translocase TatB subunit
MGILDSLPAFLYHFPCFHSQEGLMFGIGMQEILVVLVIALVVIGPKKLPEVAKALGKGYGEFRRAFEDLKNTINVDMKTEEEKENIRRIHESTAADMPERPVPEAMPEPAAAPVPVADEKGSVAGDEQESAQPEVSGGERKQATDPAPAPPYDNQDEEVEGGGD